MADADLLRQAQRALLSGCGIATTMLATGAVAGETGTAGCATACAPASGTERIRINVGENERTALVHVPANYAHGRAAPLILDLQASGIAPDIELAITRFDVAAEKAGISSLCRWRRCRTTTEVRHGTFRSTSGARTTSASSRR